MDKSFDLKGTSYGLTLILNPDVMIEKLLTDICMKFAENRSFFGQTEMVLSIKGRSLSDEEFTAVVQAIEYNSDITISLVEIEDHFKEAEFFKSRKNYETKRIYDNAHIHIGNVPYGKHIHSDSGLVVIGDVDEGAEITAAGNIIVTGVLNGLASAGQPGNSECFIYAGLIKSTTLIIGEQEGELPPKKGFFKDKKKDGGDVLLFRKDHFIITNIQDEIFMNYPNKKKG
ncbi:MAG: septum site-determining protein MinC [Lachnospiraceae bacterium]|nr:hypothetical protein [Lachnospiraceae bacterium]MDD7702754.1 septum site-determining protein MinC [Lachnospiraceae bacterium]MDY3302390.1 septum site-determining protein MinC [Lachnospiraceae bacterium]